MASRTRRMFDSSSATRTRLEVVSKRLTVGSLYLLCEPRAEVPAGGATGGGVRVPPAVGKGGGVSASGGGRSSPAVMMGAAPGAEAVTGTGAQTRVGGG